LKNDFWKFKKQCTALSVASGPAGPLLPRGPA
jgi:hypothetical protein